MASRTDQLLAAFERVVREPWSAHLSGAERIWFLVFDPAELRRVEMRMGDFESAARRANRRWVSISLKSYFPRWMADHDYRDAYFDSPNALNDQLAIDFYPYVLDYLSAELDRLPPDSQTVIALRDVAALFGFVRLSDVLNALNTRFEGRLVVFFPGEFTHNQYRLLDARDGWSYLARPITI